MNQQRLLCSCSPTDLPSATQYRCTFLHTLLVPWHALLGSRVPYHSWYGRSLTLMDMIIAAFSFPLGIYTRPRTGTDTQYALHTTHSRLARFHSATSKPPIMSHALSFPFRMPPLPFPAHPFPRVYPSTITDCKYYPGLVPVIGVWSHRRDRFRARGKPSTPQLQIFATYPATARFTTHMTSLAEPPAHAPVLQGHFKVCGTGGTRRLPGQTDEALGRF